MSRGHPTRGPFATQSGGGPAGRSRSPGGQQGAARAHRRVKSAQSDEAVDVSVVAGKYSGGQTEALESRFGREPSKLVSWQLEVDNVNEHQRESMQARIRQQQVLGCAIHQQKETTRQLLHRVMHAVEENLMVMRLASPALAQTQSEVRGMAQQASTHIAAMG